MGESRVWYCAAYEQSAANTCAFKLLRSLVSQGVNLLLVGPDGFAMDEGIEAAYSSEENPFGHERVLAAMLLGQRPWAAAILGRRAAQLPAALVQMAERPPQMVVAVAGNTAGSYVAVPAKSDAHVIPETTGREQTTDSADGAAS